MKQGDLSDVPPFPPPKPPSPPPFPSATNSANPPSPTSTQSENSKLSLSQISPRPRNPSCLQSLKLSHRLVLKKLSTAKIEEVPSLQQAFLLAGFRKSSSTAINLLLVKRVSYFSLTAEPRTTMKMSPSLQLLSQYPL
ncbi:hypothetical protein NE237_008696 [Protea cynaroides]|uniref:Uncharacterized protein n=1 Tax=Protea cynaroides TaxID=273540 RepID=A0A9Q0KX73_9MAGN|nr:hypothetical protein NE237_008696 [Protea cynaroides]